MSTTDTPNVPLRCPTVLSALSASTQPTLGEKEKKREREMHTLWVYSVEGRRHKETTRRRWEATHFDCLFEWIDTQRRHVAEQSWCVKSSRKMKALTSQHWHTKTPKSLFLSYVRPADSEELYHSPGLAQRSVVILLAIRLERSASVQNKRHETSRNEKNTIPTIATLLFVFNIH